MLNPEPTVVPTLAVTPAWIVYSWPPVLWQAHSPPPRRFVHLGTRVLQPAAGQGCAGQTVWGDTASPAVAGLAWDWIELQRGVVAMADPFGLVTNLTLLDAQGERLPLAQATMQLNELVHTFPWQQEVQRALLG